MCIRDRCKGHFIRVKVLEGRVLSHVQRVTDYILRHEDYFRKVMEEQLRVERRIQLQGDYGAFGSLLCGESKRYIT